MLVAHRIRLDPNKVQASCLARAAGAARFAYNWALAEWNRQYAAHRADPALPAPSQLSLRRQLNAIKRAQFPWMLEVTKTAPQMAIIQLGRAFENFFKRRARYPSFRRKGRTTDLPCLTTSSQSTINASASRSSAGCACARRFVSPAVLSRQQ
jgi:putative transposase